MDRGATDEQSEEGRKRTALRRFPERKPRPEPQPQPEPLPGPQPEPQPEPVRVSTERDGGEESVAPRPPARPRSGFWGRNGGFGLTFIRAALGFLFILPRNPLAFGDPWSSGEMGFYPLELVEYWALALSDRRELFYASARSRCLPEPSSCWASCSDRPVSSWRPHS